MTTNILHKYWHSYGGITAMIRSWYFWSSVLITAILYPHWSTPNWWDDVLSIMPNLLGFTLGGYAMWIAIGDDDFRKLISGKEEEEDGKPSPYMEVNVTFIHFIVLQLLSIVLGLIAKAYYFRLDESGVLNKFIGDYLGGVSLTGYAFSYFIFIYALLSALAAAFALLRVSSWYDESQTEERRKQREEQMKE